MDKKGPIVLIDDDEDDLRMFIEIFADMNLNNEVHLFKNTASVIAFLQRPDVDPFLIISDINMPVLNGFELRDLLEKDPVIQKKNAPYLFFSTVSGVKAVPGETRHAFQGVFRKPSKKSEWREVLEAMVKYWSLSIPPHPPGK